MSAPVLVAEQVTIRYRGDAPPAVVDGSISVAAGETVGIVGESGSGKSTFAKALVGLIEPSEGAIRVAGRPWREVRRRDPERRRVQMIFQDPYAALNPRLTARRSVAEALSVVRGVPGAEADEQADELLASVGLDARAVDLRPRALSGGQRQRVVIARALACDPDIVVADEPTSSLDVSAQAQVLNLLARLRAERGLGIVLISHDLAVVRHITDEVLVMRSGRIVESGPTEAVMSAPSHPYTATLLGRDAGAAAEAAAE